MTAGLESTIIRRPSRWRRLAKFILAPSGFKVGLLVTLLTVSLHPYLQTWAFWSPELLGEFLTNIDDEAHDVMFHLRGVDERPRERLPVVIIDIDEKSLQQLGQWPWPRDLITRILRQAAAAKPRAIGLDIIFAEPDRSSLRQHLPRLARVMGRSEAVPEGIAELEPAETVDVLAAVVEATPPDPAGAARLMDNDAIFAEFIEAMPRLVLGFYLQTVDDGLYDPEVPPPYSGSFVVQRSEGSMVGSIFKRKGMVVYRPVTNTLLLDDAAETRCGAINVTGIQAGTVRRVPMVWEFQDAIYPALGLQMVRVGEYGDDKAGVVEIGPFGVAGISIGPESAIQLPTDKLGHLYVNYRGPARTFPYVSAVDVLAGTLPPETFADKYLLMGTSAAGLMDLRATPFSEAAPGVEVHANIIDNILQEDMLYEPDWAHAAEMCIMLFGGLVLAFGLTYTRPLVGALFAVVFIFGICFYAYYAMFFEQNILKIVYPVLTLVSVFMSVTLFNYFTEGRQKRFIQGAFSTYLSTELVQQLMSSPERLSLAGEEKTLTVLFSDIRGFTSISERLTAEGLAQFLNEYLTPMSDIVMQNHGFVDKYIGDAVMAFWGAPVDDPRHARHATRAALQMMARLHALQPGWAARDLPPIDIGIGVNSGVMRVGNMGSSTRFNYTVMGDNVNLGSRLEGLNKPYGTNIIVSEFTRAMLGDHFFCRYLDKIRVKGKKEPVRIYEVLCEGEPSPQQRTEVRLAEEALAAYMDQHFKEAGRIFKVLAEEHGEKRYHEFLERIATFREHPPGADWDGVYTFTTK